MKRVIFWKKARMRTGKAGKLPECLRK